jgi:transcriptional regulator with XRE-family HTH domain
VTIRRYRQQRDLFQTMLAAMTGLSSTYIGEIEQGQRNLSVLSLVRIADALGLSVSQLLEPLDTYQRPSPPLTK